MWLLLTASVSDGDQESTAMGPAEPATAGSPATPLNATRRVPLTVPGAVAEKLPSAATFAVAMLLAMLDPDGVSIRLTVCPESGYVLSAVAVRVPVTVKGVL